VADSVPFDLVVRNGTLVSAAGRRAADIGIRDGRFAEIAEPGALSGSGREPLDATGLLVLPGLIDSHVHFREPGLTHKEDWLTGSRAAVMGGITTVLDMPNTIPPTDSPAAVEAKLRLADERSYCDFGLFGLLSDASADRVDELTAHGSVVGLKVFLGPTTGDLAPPSDGSLLRGLRLAAASGVRVAFHAEDAAVLRADPDARPVEAEVVAIDHVAQLLEATGASGHVCHVSSAEGLAALERLRSRGLDLTAEVTPHHCFLTAGDVAQLGAVAKVNPPIREAGEGSGLLTALASSEIDCIASDHAPHAPDEKSVADSRRAPAGISGVETSLTLFLTRAVNEHRLSPERLVEAMSEAPARAWGLWPRKGSVQVGSDADLTLVDLDRQGLIRGAELHGKHGLTPFEGWPTRGAAVATIVRGRVVMRDGQLLGEPGWGRAVSRLR
jgi:dihydroorotase